MIRFVIYWQKMGRAFEGFCPFLFSDYDSS